MIEHEGYFGGEGGVDGKGRLLAFEGGNGVGDVVFELCEFVEH